MYLLHVILFDYIQQIPPCQEILFEFCIFLYYNLFFNILNLNIRYYITGDTLLSIPFRAGRLAGAEGDGAVAELVADGSDGALELFLPRVAHGALGDVERGDGEHPDGRRRPPRAARELHGGALDVLHQAGGRLKPLLARDGAEAAVLDRDLHAAAVESLPPQAHGDTVGERREPRAHLLPAGEVVRKCRAVADGLDRLALRLRPDGAAVKAVGVFVQLAAELTEQFL